MATNLYFFTHRYPYGGETFVGNEINALSKFYDKVKFFPTATGEIKDKLPANTELKRISQAQIGKMSLIIKNFRMIALIFWLDLIKNSDKLRVLKKFKYNFSVLLNTIRLTYELEKEIKNDPADKKHVCFWMDEWALALSILKYRGKIKHFVFRVHQHDLYLDDNINGYIPFRFFNMKMCSAIFPDSVRGVNFLKSFNYFPEKMKIGHLGVEDKGTNAFDKNKFTIVSCSALVSRKRVEEIADVLKLVKVNLTWVHFGAKGEKGLFESLQKKCSELPQNIKVELKGDVSYDELIQYYRTNPVSLFITLSRSEGLPVSVIEAVSFGIPVIAADVMGLPDVVTTDSGIIVEPELDHKKIAAIINDFPNSERNTPEFRIRTKKFWEKNFSSEVNYKKFNDFVMSLA